ILGAAVGIFAVTRLARINNDVGAVYDENLQTQSVALLRNAVNRTWLDARDHFLALDPAAKAAKKDALATDESAVATALANLRKFPMSPAQQSAATDFDSAWASYLSVLHNELIPVSDRTDFAALAALRTAKIDPLSKSIRASLDTLAAEAVRVSAARKAGAGTDY